MHGLRLSFATGLRDDDMPRNEAPAIANPDEMPVRGHRTQWSVSAYPVEEPTLGVYDRDNVRP
jgi:hypothetical protein